MGIYYIFPCAFLIFILEGRKEKKEKGKNKEVK